MKNIVSRFAIGLSMICSSLPIFAECPEAERAEVVHYIPTFFTGGTSLALSGAGYVVDAGVYLTSRLLFMGVVCGVPTLGVAGLSNDAHMASQVFNACAEGVIRAEDSDFPKTNIGSYTFRATASWRCPMFVD